MADENTSDGVSAGQPATGEKPETSDDGTATKSPWWLTEIPYMLVLATASAGIVVVAAAYFKRGPALIAGALLLGAVFRLFLSSERVGMLGVRGRWFDVFTLVGLAMALIVLAWVAPQL
ncbi:DUF3017 domain-containing protein [Spiractinospora alimapuensis]|uniref:DUF3017 domain-containing protein n=1 Tax=Spiractinospora alimapuensis TaxID=2820884 RepID=UPI001F41010E|nr:DUF3017 domain-containing protein [Spiractinospora alimapuensis]QVQ51129.1 DUF3017 domain-containing protein [Spiractinospora alimapuensis]